MLENFTRATFEPLVQGQFQVHVESAEPVTLVLIRVAPLGSGQAEQAIGAGKREPFSLLFKGPGKPTLAQGTRRFTHSALGSFEIFTVPVGQEEDAMLYEAVFS